MQEAKAQLTWRYGHFAYGRSRELNRFYGLYEEWLADIGQTHSAALFRDWATRHYLPAHCWAQIETLSMPERIPLDTVATAQFRCHNRSRHPWEMKTAANLGVHLYLEFRGVDCDHAGCSYAGFQNKTIAPGEYVDLKIAIPPIPKPGRYRMFVDMKDEVLGWFADFGSQRLEIAFEVYDANGSPTR